MKIGHALRAQLVKVTLDAVVDTQGKRLAQLTDLNLVVGVAVADAVNTLARTYNLLRHELIVVRLSVLFHFCAVPYSVLM